MVDGVMGSLNNSQPLDDDAPLWQRLMTGTNMVGLAAYFSLLLLGFWGIKLLADDDGSKSDHSAVHY